MAEKSSELNKIDSTDDAADENALQRRKFDEDNDDFSSVETLETRDDDDAAADEETSDEAEQIREQIVETRRGMSETIDAIQEKLSFANISEQVQTQVSEQINNAVETAKDVFYDKTAEVVNTVGRSFRQIGDSDLAKKARQNPTALALIGAGIGALLVGVLSSGGKKKKKADLYSYEYGYQPTYRTKLRYDSDFEASPDFDTDYDGDEVRYADSSRRELTTGETALSKKRASAPENAQSPTPREKVGGAAIAAYQSVSETASAAYGGAKEAAGSAYETVGEAASKTYETASSIAGKTYETVGGAAGKTYQALGSAAGFTYEKAGDLGEQMKTNYDHYIEENPLAVGAVAFAVGAAIGFAIPLTRKENEYLGEYRDQVFETVQAKAQETIGSVKDLATEAQKAITEEVKSKTA